MRRHRIDALSLAGGLFFVALGVAFYSGGVDLTDDGFRWIWPAAFGGLALVVLATVRPARPTASTETLVPEAQEAGEVSAEDVEAPEALEGSGEEVSDRRTPPGPAPSR